MERERGEINGGCIRLLFPCERERGEINGGLLWYFLVRFVLSRGRHGRERRREEEEGEGEGGSNDYSTLHGLFKQ